MLIWIGHFGTRERCCFRCLRSKIHAAEGEFVPGLPAQPYYYGPDQIGSVRRVFASATSAPAYSYDSYGVRMVRPVLVRPCT